MSEDYSPTPWQVPPPGGAHRPVSMRTNTVFPADASNGDMGVLMDVAQNIVTGNSNQLDRFVNNNRQQHFISGRKYGDVTRDLDGMRIRHRINDGFEKIDLDVYPHSTEFNSASASETNLDGYMIWVHGEGQYGGGQAGQNTFNSMRMTCSPYCIVFNGYLIEQRFQPPILLPGNCMGYVFVFGGTALLGPSLAQDLDNANPLIRDAKFRQPFKLNPAPGWGQDVGSGLDGTKLDKEPRKLGYWLFDWLSDHNPAQYLNTANSYGAPPIWKKWENAFVGSANGVPAALGAPYFGDLTLTNGIYFPSTTKSILKPRGVNGMRVFSLSSFPPQGQIWDVMLGEFFDRGKYRVVRQSWTIPPQPNRAIKANDYPNRYLDQTFYNGYSYGGYTANFDLSGTFSANAKNRKNGAANSPMSTLGDAATDASLTATQAAAIIQWQQQCQSIESQFSQSQSVLLTKLLKIVTDMQLQVIAAHELAFIMRGWTGNFLLYTSPDQFPNDATFYTPPTPPNAAPITSGVPAIFPSNNFVTGTEEIVTYVFVKGSGFIPDSYQAVSDVVTLTVIPQTFWLMVPSLNYLEGNATGLGGTITSLYTHYVQTGIASDTTSGTPQSGSVTTNITYSYSAQPDPPNVGLAPWQYFGPASSVQGLEPIMDAFITNTMVAYTIALKNYNAAGSAAPPALPPFPGVGNPLTDFKYEKFSFSDKTPQYSQSGT